MVIYSKLKCCDSDIKFTLYGDKAKDDRSVKSTIQKHLKRQHNMNILMYINNYIQKLDLCGFCNKHFAEYTYDVIFNNGCTIQNIKLKNDCYKCSDKQCMKDRASINSNSYEHIMKRYKISYDEAKSYLFNHNKSPFYKQENETELEYKKRQSRSIHWFINKFGEDVGKQKWKEHADKISKANKKQSMIERFGEEKANQICKSKGITLQNMINKYGTKLGTEKYINHTINCTKIKYHINSTYINSKQAYVFFSEIKTLLVNQNICKNDDIIYSDGNQSEYRIMYFEQNKLRYVKLDFVIKSLKTCIEFNGSTWHAGEHNKNNWVHPCRTWDELIKYEHKRDNLIKKHRI